jgi:hypothetical protein
LGEENPFYRKKWVFLPQEKGGFRGPPLNSIKRSYFFLVINAFNVETAGC